MIRAARLIVFSAALLAGCSTTQDPTTQTEKSFLGHGSEITQVSPVIYRIGVTMKSGATTEEARDQALLKASELALTKGYTHFEIVGGDGFRRIPRKVQAGPVPVSLYSEPEGSIQIKLLQESEAGTGSFDAAAEKRRITGQTSNGA